MRRLACLLLSGSLLLGGAAVASAQAPAPVNTLSWTARDLDRAYGFVVYRAPAAEGPFLRLNKDIIRASPNQGEYRYVDRDVVAGTTYYYQIDAVSQTGVKKRLSPPLPKKTGGTAASAELPATGKAGGSRGP
jgi:hypothetical protein